MFNIVLTNASKRLNNIIAAFKISADALGIKANDAALNKLMSKCPTYFKINSTTDVKIEIVKNDFKSKFFMLLYFNLFIINIHFRIPEA